MAQNAITSLSGNDVSSPEVTPELVEVQELIEFHSRGLSRGVRDLAERAPSLARSAVRLHLGAAAASPRCNREG